MFTTGDDIHKQLIRNLLDGFAKTPAEFAAANEIKSLQAAITELEAKVRMLGQHPTEADQRKPKAK